jgi:hypothetical protein
MFWIYLILFILTIFVPSLIPQSGIGFLSEETAEEMAIFLLGTSVFLIFLWKERTLNRKEKERIKIQKEAKLVSKNLSDTYLYIGEINRKLDILKHLVLELPRYASKIISGKEREFFSSIIESVRLLSKSRNFKIVFIDIEAKKIIYEISGNKKLKIKDDLEDIIKRDINFLNKDKYLIASSTKEIDKICATIIIQKKNKYQKFEDPEILEALASQALLLFVYSRKNKSA